MLHGLTITLFFGKPAPAPSFGVVEIRPRAGERRGA
jgi:hypothetical protein